MCTRGQRRLQASVPAEVAGTGRFDEREERLWPAAATHTMHDGPDTAVGLSRQFCRSHHENTHAFASPCRGMVHAWRMINHGTYSSLTCTIEGSSPTHGNARRPRGQRERRTAKATERVGIVSQECALRVCGGWPAAHCRMQSVGEAESGEHDEYDDVCGA